MLGDQREGLCPARFDIVVGGCIVAHGMGQATLVLQPVIGLIGQGADAVAGKEGRIDRAPGGLPVDGLGAVLAKLYRVVFRRLTPGATRAVEAAILVGLEHGPQILEGVVTAQPAFGHALERTPTGGGAFVVADVWVLAHG